MAGSEQSIREKLDSISQRMDAILTEVRQTKVEMTKVEGRMDHKLDTLRQAIEEKIEQSIADSGDTLRQEWKTHMANEMDPVKTDVSDLKRQITDANKELERLRKLVDKPYDPERTVVIYDLLQAEEESLEDCVSWLLVTILEVDSSKPSKERYERQK